MTPKSRSPRKKKVLPADGDCYEAAGKFISERLLDGDRIRFLLVHGEVRGQGPLMGVNFGHAWVIDKTSDSVIDRSNGRNLVMPRFIYYAIGGVEEIGNFHEYTAEEARNMLLETGSYGPWDLVTSSGL
jgi:hypothetical protein